MSIKFRTTIGRIKVLNKIPNKTTLNSSKNHNEIQGLEIAKRKNDVKVRNLEYTNMQKFR